MNPVVFTLSWINVNDFENSVDELQEFCTVQLYRCTTGTGTDTGVQFESIALLNLNAWRLPEGTACMATAGSRNRYYPQPHLAQGARPRSDMYRLLAVPLLGVLQLAGSAAKGPADGLPSFLMILGDDIGEHCTQQWLATLRSILSTSESEL